MSVFATEDRFLYIVEAEIPMVKIGVSFRPRDRAMQILGSSPVLVRLIAMWPGCGKDETVLHRRFDDFRTHCEWFRCEGPVADFVAERRGTGLDEILPWEIATIWGRTVRNKRHARVRMLRHWEDRRATAAA